MRERWRPPEEEPERRGEGAGPLHCWACEELLAWRGTYGELLLEADASQERIGDQESIICGGCGEATILPGAPAGVGEQAMMSDREGTLAPEARLVLDYRHETRGFWSDGAVFRIRIYARDDQTPVVIASELPENRNVSVTNFAEVLAAEVLSRHLPQRFDYDEPAVFLEHYPAHRDDEKFEFDRVAFGSWTPRVKYIGGVKRISLGEPQWSPMTPAHLAALLGAESARAVIEEREE